MNLFNNQIIKEDMDNIFQHDIDWDILDNSSVLVTGSYGMLASYLIYFLSYLNIFHNKNIKIIAQGRNIIKAKERFGELFYRDFFSFSDVDITRDKLDSFADADYIIHAAGIANPNYYSTNPVEVIEPNAIGTYRLLDNLKENKEFKGFLFFSSGDIYGKVNSPGLIDENTLGAIDPIDNHSCYGESKRAGEMICSAFFKEYGLRTVMARIGHTYGPTMNLNEDPRVFSSFIKDALEGKSIVIHSDGSAKRPFCYITDAVFGYLLLLIKGKGGEAYNVTNTDQFISIKEVAEIVSRLPEKKIEIVFKPRNVNENYLENKINIENRPTEKKLIDLGWNHTVSSEKGFKRVFDYFSDNKL